MFPGVDRDGVIHVKESARMFVKKLPDEVDHANENGQSKFNGENFSKLFEIIEIVVRLSVDHEIRNNGAAPEIGDGDHVTENQRENVAQLQLQPGAEAQYDADHAHPFEQYRK